MAGSAAPAGGGPSPDPAPASAPLCLEWRGAAAGELHRSEELYRQRLSAVLKVGPPLRRAGLGAGLTPAPVPDSAGLPGASERSSELRQNHPHLQRDPAHPRSRRLRPGAQQVNPAPLCVCECVCECECECECV